MVCFRSTGRHRQQEYEEAQISAILSMFDFPDHVIDMKAYIMGMTLSLDQK